jgi:hypothetical protein
VRCSEPLTTLTTDRCNLRTSDGTFGSGSTRLGLSQKGGLPVRCWLQHLMLRFKAIDARVKGQPYGLLLYT